MQANIFDGYKLDFRFLLYWQLNSDVRRRAPEKTRKSSSMLLPLKQSRTDCREDRPQDKQAENQSDAS